MLDRVEARPFPFPVIEPPISRRVAPVVAESGGESMVHLSNADERKSSFTLAMELYSKGVELIGKQRVMLFYLIQARYIDGKENEEISKDLCLSLPGLEFHIRNLKKKLKPLITPGEDDELLAAAKMAIDLGLIKPNKIEEAKLTDRQRQVLDLLRQNLSNKNIASTLGSSLANLEGLLREIFCRTSLQKGFQLAASVPGNVTQLHSCLTHL